jgi:hypothetical protein
MKIVFGLLMILGVLVAVQPAFQAASVVGLWSDFKQFGARVADMENGSVILSLGGEDDSETFEDLLDKLWALKNSSTSGGLGVLIIFLAAFGLVLDIAKEKRASKAVETVGPTSP